MYIYITYIYIYITYIWGVCVCVYGTGNWIPNPFLKILLSTGLIRLLLRLALNLLELVIFQPPSFWDYRHAALHQA